MDKAKPSALSPAGICLDVVNTRECRQAVLAVVREVLIRWSGDSRIKQGLKRPADWAAEKLLAIGVKGDVKQALARPEVLTGAAEQAAPLVNGTLDLLMDVCRALDDMPDAQKKAVFDRLLLDLDGEKIGRWITQLSVIFGNACRNDSAFLSDRLPALLEKILAATDFGELKELFDEAQTDLQALMEQIVALVFDNPAKLVTLLTFLPGGANLSLSLLNQIVRQVNLLPPDILADMMLSLFREVDATALGDLVNRLNEVVRQLHTGSALIGEVEAPRFSTDLTRKVDDLLSRIDPRLLRKAAIAFQDGREALDNVFIDAMADRPEWVTSRLTQLTVRRNAAIRRLKRKIEILESLPEADTVEALSLGLSHWNAVDLAEVANATARMVEGIHDADPELLKGLIVEFVQGLNLYDMEDLIHRLARDLGSSLRPVARFLAPLLIREFCDWFEPGEDGEDDDGQHAAMAEARDRLRRWILGTEDRP